MLFGQVHNAVIIQLFGGWLHAVGYDPVAPAGNVELTTVGQMSSLEEVHTHQRVPGLHKSIVDRQVGCRPGERLHVDIDILGRHLGGGKEMGATPLGQCLDEVHVACPFVEASVGIAPVVDQLVVIFQEQIYVILAHTRRRVTFGVDVVKDGPKCLANRQGRYALRGDEDNVTCLPFLLQSDGMFDIGVNA